MEEVVYPERGFVFYSVPPFGLLPARLTSTQGFAEEMEEIVCLLFVRVKLADPFRQQNKCAGRCNDLCRFFHVNTPVLPRSDHCMISDAS